MTPYRAVLLALVVVGGMLTAAAVPTGATGVDVGTNADAEATAGPIEDARPTATANDTTNNSTLGADISSFMQSSTAEVDGAVETGMWTAAFNATENQSVQVRLVERRTTELRMELVDLQQRKQELIVERKEGNVTETAYKAKVSRLLGQINALRSAIDATSARAKQTNASVESLDALRTETKNLTGPEIASVARNTTGVRVGNGQGGPPGDVGNGNQAGNSNPAGNSNSAADANNETGGQPSNVGDDTNDTNIANETNTTNAINGTNATDSTNANSSGGPPDDSDDPSNAPIADDSSGNETATPNGSVPGTTPGNEVGLGADSDSAPVVTSTVTTPELFDRVSDALSVRTYALDYTLTVA